MPTTLAQLRTQAQARADFENDTNVTNVSWASFINGSRKRLRRLLVSANPQLFLASNAFTFAGSTFQLSLAALSPAFWKVLALDFSTAGSGADAFMQVPRFLWHERNRVWDRAYRAYGNTLEVRPAQAAAGNYVLWYVSQPVALVADGDQLDVVEDMYDEFIILDAASKARRRQQKDSAALDTELMALEKDVRIAAADNDVGEPDRVLDVEDAGYRRPWLPRP